MAIDKKTIRAAIKNKTKKPKAFAKDLKAVEVAGVSNDLKRKLFKGTAYGTDGAFDMYMAMRKKGVNPSKAYAEIWSMSQDELDEFSGNYGPNGN